MPIAFSLISVSNASLTSCSGASAAASAKLAVRTAQFSMVLRVFSFMTASRIRVARDLHCGSFEDRRDVTRLC